MAPWECWDPAQHLVDTGKLAPLMLLIVVALLFVMGLAGLVAAVAAAPERGQSTPRPVRVSDRVTRLRDRLEP